MPIDIRFFARQAMPRALAEGLSVNRFIGIIKETYGKAYRRTTLLKDWREMAGLPEKEERLKYVRKEYRPDPASITPTLGAQQRKYVYTFQVTGMDTITGQEITQTMSVASDTLLTRAEAEEQALENYDWYTPEIIFDKLTWKKVTSKP